MRFLDCTGGQKKPSPSILDVGVEAAIGHSGFDETMFFRRGGKYIWSKADMKLDWWKCTWFTKSPNKLGKWIESNSYFQQHWHVMKGSASSTEIILHRNTTWQISPFVLTDLIIILCEKADPLTPYFCGKINRNRRSKELRLADNGHLKPQALCHPVSAGGERVHYQVQQSRIPFQLLWHGIQNIFKILTARWQK